MLHPADLELISTKAAALDDMLEDRWQRGGELMPLAAALMNLLVNPVFEIQHSVPGTAAACGSCSV
ncbi:hypothetical protein [Escherichia coli]|uniref:hypothetical protein n=1 Tax=Escherichia coli TaxID=562 RepID=UPI002FCD57CF